ncbi:hypothetical protein QQF64_024137, partial [Cirrhinus molitorella]
VTLKRTTFPRVQRGGRASRDVCVRENERRSPPLTVSQSHSRRSHAALRAAASVVCVDANGSKSCGILRFSPVDLYWSNLTCGLNLSRIDRRRRNPSGDANNPLRVHPDFASRFLKKGKAPMCWSPELRDGGRNVFARSLFRHSKAALFQPDDEAMGYNLERRTQEMGRDRETLQ